MCCSANDYKIEQINGECEVCGEDTVDGDAFESCGYSPVECDVCDSVPCDQSC